MARALLVGGSSYVGRCLLQRLGLEGWDVWPTFFRHPQGLGSRAIRLDVRDQLTATVLFKEIRPDVVFHLAYDMGDLEGSIVSGTANLLKAWRSAGCYGSFILVSTDMVFDGEAAPYKEEDSPKPITAYGMAKRKAELLAGNAGAKVVRLSLVYGWNPPDPRTASLLRGLGGKGFDYPYFVDEIRSPIFLQDLCMALGKMAAMGPQMPSILHLAGPQSLSRHEMACQVAEALGFGRGLVPKAKLVDFASVRPRDLSLDISKAKRLLSFKPRTIREALQGAALQGPG